MSKSNDSKAESKCACIVYAVVAYDEPEIGQIVIFSVNQVVEMRGLDYHLLCPMQNCMNSVLIDEVQMFLVPIPGDTMHAIQIENPFNATDPIIIPLKLNH